MPAPRTPYGRKVTGEAKFIKNWRGQLILQVQVEDKPLDSAMGESSFRWINAQEDDLYALRYYRKHRKLEPLL